MERGGSGEKIGNQSNLYCLYFLAHLVSGLGGKAYY